MISIVNIRSKKINCKILSLSIGAEELQKRIFQASGCGDVKACRKLQHTLIRSQSLDSLRVSNQNYAGVRY
ncbi:reverse transcriptase N-terminal domain-containing protein [Kamptonema sp. UHCC 0994]|nr:reverse transcriptase N-terminal domain-containing protein [Kamptonema sp. UHCC 0994]MDF0555034.1 reverse transcriptase N-terminal domain-containing protein [Kamptonema sp. UHCC 0994]